MTHQHHRQGTGELQRSGAMAAAEPVTQEMQGMKTARQSPAHIRGGEDQRRAGREACGVTRKEKSEIWFATCLLT